MWREQAACIDMDVNIFYEGVASEAKAICARCPVRVPCAVTAIMNGEPHGVWGGLTERQRRAIRRRVPAAELSEAV